MTTQTPAVRRDISGSAEGFDWRTRSACRDADPEIFFPAPGKSSRPAKQVCRRCPVAEPCLAWALELREDFGVWGAQSRDQRRKTISDAYQARARTDLPASVTSHAEPRTATQAPATAGAC